jgi:RNA polymerase sigma-70 factor, ECF subfamily
MQSASVQTQASSSFNLNHTSHLHWVQPGLKELAWGELLKKCLESRDEEAWREFIRRSQPLISSVILKTMRRWTVPAGGLVDDLVQDTYLKLCIHDFKALRSFECRHENALLGFLKVVAANVVQDHFRSRYSQKRGSGKTNETLDFSTPGLGVMADFIDRAERNVLVGQIKDCLKAEATEPESIRNLAIFRLYYEEGYTAEAIARLSGIGLSTKGVESALLRLTKSLKARLGPNCQLTM